MATNLRIVTRTSIDEEKLAISRTASLTMDTARHEAEYTVATQ